MVSSIPPPHSSWLDRLPGLAMLAFLPTGMASVLWGAPDWAWPQDVGIVDGAWASALEREVDEANGYRQLGVVFFGWLEYFVFGEGRPGVLVGEDGWLFTTEEFELCADEDAELSAWLDRVEQVRTRLDAQDSALVVALLPAKARLYPEQLGRYRWPEASGQRYERFRDGLLARGVQAPDLAGPMQAQAADGEPLFLRTDTHWTPQGAALVARLLADATRPDGLAITRYATQAAAQPLAHEGDLLSYLPLGPLQALGPAPDLVRTVQTQPAESDAGLGLFDEVSIPITLVGTSYSAAESWNFSGALRQAYQADVLDAAQEGRGPLQPMLEYLEDESFVQSPPALVVWEIPERYLCSSVFGASVSEAPVEVE